MYGTVKCDRKYYSSERRITGAGLLEDMPYSDKDYTSKPSKTASDNAAKYKIDFWRQVNVLDIKEVKAQVNAGFPVIIGTALDEGL
ncbi:MAG: hypothetical protein WDO19_29625 [Bacteroidota bacterium]